MSIVFEEVAATIEPDAAPEAVRQESSSPEPSPEAEMEEMKGRRRKMWMREERLRAD